MQLQADRGFASRAVFYRGGRGRFGKKGVTLHGLRISENKEILRKLTVCTYIRNYLSTLSTKDFANINKITMVTPFAGSYCMTLIFFAPPPRCNLFAMDCLRALSKDFIELCKLAKKKIN
jgi:hypothetical protein